MTNNIYAQILNKELNFVSTEILGERQAAGWIHGKQSIFSVVREVTQ